MKRYIKNYTINCQHVCVRVKINVFRFFQAYYYINGLPNSQDLFYLLPAGILKIYKVRISMLLLYTRRLHQTNIYEETACKQFYVFYERFFHSLLGFKLSSSYFATISKRDFRSHKSNFFTSTYSRNIITGKKQYDIVSLFFLIFFIASEQLN